MASNSYSAPTPPEFISKNYVIWAGKMKTYLRAYDPWEVVQTCREPKPQPTNPT